jgi:hypothetical protein
MRYIAVFIFASILNYSCGNTPKNINRLDTVVVAYNQAGQYTFNKAIVWTHIDRRFKNAKDLDAVMTEVQQFAIRLPTSKADSSMDSTTHKWIVKDSYPIVFLPDSLSKYLHVIDTLHSAPPPASKPVSMEGTNTVQRVLCLNVGTNVSISTPQYSYYHRDDDWGMQSNTPHFTPLIVK